VGPKTRTELNLSDEVTERGVLVGGGGEGGDGGDGKGERE